MKLLYKPHPLTLHYRKTDSKETTRRADVKWIPCLITQQGVMGSTKQCPKSHFPIVRLVLVFLDILLNTNDLSILNVDKSSFANYTSECYTFFTLSFNTMFNKEFVHLNSSIHAGIYIIIDQTKQ